MPALPCCKGPRLISSPKSGVTHDVVANFERAVDALAHDPAFGDVEFVDHRSKRSGRVRELTLVVDREGGVDVARCEQLAARVNEALAECDEPYVLSVESAGLERPLTKPQDYERFREREIVVKTTLAIACEYTHAGILAGVRGSAIVLRTPKGELPIPLAAVKSAHLAYDPRADLRRAKQEKRDRHAR